jgi:hypothetical protein
MNAAQEQSQHPQAPGSSEPTPEYPQGPGQEPPPSPGDGGSGCPTCDLADIDTMACSAKRFARQAEVMNEAATDLDNYRKQYDEARAKYSDARTGADADLTEIATLLSGLGEQLRCRLQDDQISCLEDGRDDVFGKIDECNGPRGCQSPCEDANAGGLENSEDIEALAAEIVRLRRNLAESATYFTALIAEPDDITAQVGKLREAANQLKSDVEGGGDKVVEWYARWLVLDAAARWERLGRGFTSVTAYMDCLCTLLRCIVSGWTVLATLEGRKAELDCYEDTRKTACDKLKAIDDVVRAVLDAYEECCEKQQQPEGGHQPEAKPEGGPSAT